MTGRREFLGAGATLAATTLLSACATGSERASGEAVPDTEHWTSKATPEGDVRLYLRRKRLADASKGTILFVHGSSVSGTPSYDLQIPGQPDASVMDWYARLGYDAWCLDCEGYGHSDKRRPINADVSTGADDVGAAVDYIAKAAGAEKLYLYGSSSGALRAALYAQRKPERVARLAVSGFVWTGEGSPTLAKRREHLAEYRASNRRPINRAFVRSIFTRDRAQTSDDKQIEAFTEAVLALDGTVPTGTYVDMCANLPLVDPSKLKVPVCIMRGEYDGIATLQDIVNFFLRLPNGDKQLIVMPGVAHSAFGSKNRRMVYDVLGGYFGRAAPAYRA